MGLVSCPVHSLQSWTGDALHPSKNSWPQCVTPWGWAQMSLLCVLCHILVDVHGSSKSSVQRRLHTACECRALSRSNRDGLQTGRIARESEKRGSVRTNPVALSSCRGRASFQSGVALKALSSPSHSHTQPWSKAPDDQHGTG